MAQSVAFVRPRGGYWPSGSAIVRELEGIGVAVDVFEDGDPAAAATGRWLIFRGSAGWYPRSMRALASLAATESPRALLWVTEPLPPPRSSGFDLSRRSLRDVAKLALRDPRANDQRTNLRWTLEFARVAPNYATPLYNLACCEAMAGHPDDAIGHLRVALERRPSLRDIAKEDTDLDSLRGEARFRELVG